MSFPLVEFLTLSITSTFTPGPNNIMCMALGQNIGFKKTIPFMFGSAIGGGIILSIVAIFNKLILLHFPFMSVPLKILGTIYLTYLAIMILYSAFRTSEQKKEKPILSEDKLFFTAILLQFVNPKTIFFAISILATYILPFYQDFYHLGLFIVFLVLLAVVALMLWAGCGSMLHSFIKHHEKPFNTVMAGLLLYCAISIAIH